jgi:hypothetical protein
MNKKKFKRREEREENNKKKRSKSYTKKEKSKKLERIVAPYILTLKYCRKDQRSCDGWGLGKGPHISYPLCSCGKKKAFDVGGPSSIDFVYFWGSNNKQRSCDGRGGARSALLGVAMS